MESERCCGEKILSIASYFIIHTVAWQVEKLFVELESMSPWNSIAFLPLIIQEMCKVCFGAERSAPGSRIVTGKHRGMRKGDKHGRWDGRLEESQSFWGEHNTEIGVIYIIPSKLLPCQDYTNETNTTALDGSAHFSIYHRTQIPPSFHLVNINIHTHSSFSKQCVSCSNNNHFLIIMFTVSISDALRIHFIFTC